MRRRLVTPAPAPMPDLAALRAELALPGAFPEEVEHEARTAVDLHAGARRDATDLALRTVDPPGAMDLDQALAVEERDDGWLVRYAIADLGALVVPGSALDREAHARGETLYLPDDRVPLHPTAMGEATASLLPGEVRPAVLWSLHVDAAGALAEIRVERATVRSRGRHTYAELQAALDSGSAPAALAPLARLGPAREAAARRRGGIELGLPSQEVVRRDDGTWTIEHRVPLPVEGWNAQISLLTGEAAARLMLDAGTGILRTLPRPTAATVARLRRAAGPLGVVWPEGTAPGEVLAGCDARDPRHAAFLDLAAELLRGAGYTPFAGTAPDEAGHAGVGSPYAHVTAPIRRLVDRYGTEVCLAIAAGRPVPPWAADRLAGLAEEMAESGRRARQVERAVVDHVEAWLLQDRVGEHFEAAVVEHDDERDRSTVVLDEPAVRAPCRGRPPLGQRIEVRLDEADVATRRVRFTPVSP